MTQVAFKEAKRWLAEAEKAGEEFSDKIHVYKNPKWHTLLENLVREIEGHASDLEVTEFERVPDIPGYYISSNAPPSGVFVPMSEAVSLKNKVEQPEADYVPPCLVCGAQEPCGDIACTFDPSPKAIYRENKRLRQQLEAHRSVPMALPKIDDQLWETFHETSLMTWDQENDRPHWTQDAVDLVAYLVPAGVQPEPLAWCVQGSDGHLHFSSSEDRANGYRSISPETRTVFPVYASPPPPASSEKPEPVEYLLALKPEYSASRGMFSRPEHKGYTNNVSEAGRYSREMAETTVSEMPDKYVAIPLSPPPPADREDVNVNILTRAADIILSF